MGGNRKRTTRKVDRSRQRLRETIVEAESGNRGYQEASLALFLELCHQSISPKVTNDNVREMLIQHILTKDIFLRVFGEDQFHRENNVARQLDALEGTFFTGNVRRQAIDRLRAYYGAIGRAADDIAEYSEKQQFLKGIYEDFYQLTTLAPPTASVWFTRPTRSWTSSFGVPTGSSRSISAITWTGRYGPDSSTRRNVGLRRAP